MCTLIAAIDEGGVIGNRGSVPWHLPEDLAQFRKRTLGGTVIMGRKTWESLPGENRFLDGRANYVVTRYQDLLAGEYSAVGVEGPHFVDSIESAIESVKKDHPDFARNICIIGGGEIFRIALDRQLVNRMIITHVEGRHVGDAAFPGIPAGWKGTEILSSKGFTVVEYTRDDYDEHGS